MDGRTDGKWRLENNVMKDSMGSGQLVVVVVGAGLGSPRHLMDVYTLTLTFENVGRREG
jgi:hypothetical protein